MQRQLNNLCQGAILKREAINVIFLSSTVFGCSLICESFTTTTITTVDGLITHGFTSIVCFSLDFHSCSLLSPTAPFSTKHCACCSLAHEQTAPQESWVFRVSIDRLHKAFYHSLCPLRHGFHKCTVYLRKEYQSAVHRQIVNSAEVFQRDCSLFTVCIFSYLEQSSVSLQPLLQTRLWKIFSCLQLLIPVYRLEITNNIAQIVSLSITANSTLL